ncbi:MAG: M28 family peptidase [Deltaproteobacteria bacterium]|nr:M28 family peptidase [Deltaproteobacteria bacterium]
MQIQSAPEDRGRAGELGRVQVVKILDTRKPTVFKIINFGKNFYESVIPRLDRGIQLVRGRLPLWIPRSSRGMTRLPLWIPRSSRGMTRLPLWIPRSSRGMTVQKKSSPQILFLNYYPSIFLLSLLIACTGQTDAVLPPAAVVASSFKVSRERAEEVLSILTQAPHPFGSARQKEIKDYLVSTVQNLGVEVSVQEFAADTPNRDFETHLKASWTTTRQGFNVTAFLDLIPSPPCIMGIGSHYDTKDMSEFAYLGANDSGSSSILLLELLAFLKANTGLNLSCDVQVIWFDGEEAVLPQWNDGLTKHPSGMQDHTYGSRHFVDTLKQCPHDADLWCVERRGNLVPFASLILLDMVGYKDLKLTPDLYSHAKLKALLVEGAKYLGKSHLIGSLAMPIEDDHIPFKEKGVPVLNIIDFSHLDLWHTPSDLPHTVSMQSLEDAGRLALYVLQKVGSIQKPTAISSKEGS